MIERNKDAENNNSDIGNTRGRGIESEVRSLPDRIGERSETADLPEIVGERSPVSGYQNELQQEQGADSRKQSLENSDLSQKQPGMYDYQNEVRDIYNSTYDERMKQTPSDLGERGEWSGERGESNFTPNNEEIKEILSGYGLESIPYKEAIPDFSDVSESTVEIEKMTENRSENFKQCDEKCAEQWNGDSKDGKNDWTARDVKEWRQDNGYSWHERNDMKTCDLVPTKVNDYFGHLGGVSECKKRDAEYNGGEFDE